MSPDFMTAIEEGPLVKNCPKCRKLNWGWAVCDHIFPSERPQREVSLAEIPAHHEQVNRVQWADGERDLNVEIDTVYADGYRLTVLIPAKEYIYEVGRNKYEIYWVKGDRLGDIGVMQKYSTANGWTADDMTLIYNELTRLFKKRYRL